jgi:XRE family transcriptional regulator, fatty acid utilization regulator
LRESLQNMAAASNFTLDPLVFGQRLRHTRRARGLTLAQLGGLVDRSAPYLSQLENGRREPTFSLVGALAGALGVDVADLLAQEPPNRRAELEVAVERAQAESLYRELGLPRLVASARVPDAALEHIIRLYEELKARQQVRAATPEDARKANAALRAEMRERGNYFPEIEALAREALAAVDYRGRGPLSPRTLDDVAAHYGFAVEPVEDLPSSVRSITDLRHRRIYIPQRDELGTQLARSVVFQTLGHVLLGHEDPRDFADFLRQRVEANYFAGAVLLPEPAAVAFLAEAQAAHDLSVEDLAEQFYVSYEMAAHRFTNLATRHLDMPVHFVRSDEQGVIWKAYENNGVPFPTDPDGAIEGQRLCRKWGTRQVFQTARRYALHYQYTDTSAGTFWCATYLEAGRQPNHAVTVGVPFGSAKHFRGRDTRTRARSACPDGACCRRPDEEAAARWRGQAWPSPRPHSHVLAALPAGTFPGVDIAEAYEFLDRHAVEAPPAS